MTSFNDIMCPCRDDVGQRRMSDTGTRPIRKITCKYRTRKTPYEGKGRGIETNLYAQFKCDSLKIGMVKHPEVAQFLGGRLYDCVFKYNEVSSL
ncbi:pantothenate kinase 4 [Trifolium pratense]|uniref:Pantothenate kinase 4 n=1 Tax=Trifolium pratense TaxID=57577 RepID=A0A2K3LV52_TRIPR|nr:pantothenate kinase 4 [Trifolium pratense]